MQEYQHLTDDLLEQLAAIAPGHIRTGKEINEDFSHDEMPLYGKHMPEAVLTASSAEEISAVMRFCNTHRIAVTPRGAGTGLVGGCVPLCGGLVIDMTHMRRILSYDLDNLTVTVEPGVLWQELYDDCQKHGLLYPPDPGEKLATIGGNVSTNAGGMRAVKYGTTRDYVRSVQVVLPTGEITQFGASVSKTSSGYSLLNLMIGSEGTLGIITQITLKVIPMPSCVMSLLIPFESLEEAITAVPMIKMSGLDPQTLEFMERDILSSSEKYLGRTVFPKEIGGMKAGAYLLVSFDGESEEAVLNTAEKASELFFKAGAIEILVADTQSRLKETWAQRSSFLDAISVEYQLVDECDVVVPTKNIPEFLIFAETYGKELGLEIKCFGHAGDGNLHLYQCSNSMSEEDFKITVDKYFSRLYRKAAACGGLVSGEHGIGSGKIKYLEETVGETNVSLMRRIKQAFDPNMILNPGKVCCTL